MRTDTHQVSGIKYWPSMSNPDGGLGPRSHFPKKGIKDQITFQVQILTDRLISNYDTLMTSFCRVLLTGNSLILFVNTGCSTKKQVFDQDFSQHPKHVFQLFIRVEERWTWNFILKNWFERSTLKIKNLNKIVVKLRSNY